MRVGSFEALADVTSMPALRATRILFLGLVLGACADPAPPPPSADAPVAEQGTAAPTPAAVRDTVLAAEAPDDAPDAPAVSVALDEAGLRFVETATGSASPLAFGAPFHQTVDAVTRAQGAPTDTGVLPECPAGPLDFATWAGGLTAYGAEDAFVGWAVNGREATASTMSGAGVGSTRAEVESAYVIEAQETSLGTEFTAGGIAGLFSGPGADATVTALWAGTSCTFR